MDQAQSEARTYVGGIPGFDRIGAELFGRLVEAGLREDDHLLDIGCGCLRVGKLLIAYLARGRYAGIDIDSRLIDAGIEYETGPGLVADKAARFEVNGTYDFSGFHTVFDVAWAGSILSHTYPDQAKAMLEGAAAVLRPGGILEATYIREGSPLARILTGPGGKPIAYGATRDGSEPGVAYYYHGWAPEGVSYDPLWIGEAASAAGFDTDFWPDEEPHTMVAGRPGQRWITCRRRST